jgi:hypothetical protein
MSKSFPPLELYKPTSRAEELAQRINAMYHAGELGWRPVPRPLGHLRIMQHNAPGENVLPFDPRGRYRMFARGRTQTLK